MVSLKTREDRTLYFDFLQLELGRIGSLTPQIHLYTVPGQVLYDASRKLILKGVDGVVFVADSQDLRLDANVESIENLKEHLREHGYDPATLPYVLQLNKRDLPGAMALAEPSHDWTLVAVAGGEIQSALPASA